MDCTQHLVMPSPNNGWISRVDGRDYGPFLSRDMALRIAVAEALIRRKSGGASRVTVKAGDGTIIAERCVCEKFGR